MTTFHDVLSTCSPFPPPCLASLSTATPSVMTWSSCLPVAPASRPIKGAREGGGLVHCRSVPTLSPWPALPPPADGGFNDDSTALLARSANGISCSRTRFCPDQIPRERTPADGDRLLDGRPRSRLLLHRSTCGPPRRAKARGSSTLKHMCKKLKQFLKEYSLN